MKYELASIFFYSVIINDILLNYVINRYLAKHRERLVALFVDFMAAFDSVDRVILREVRGNVQRDKEQGKTWGGRGG